MKNKNIFFAIISFIIIVFCIVLPFVFQKYGLSITSDDIKILYIVSKIAFCSIFVFAIVYCTKNTNSTSKVIIYCNSLVVQLTPLLIRVISSFIITLLISMAVFVISLSVIFSFILLGNKMREKEKALQGKMYEVGE